MNKLIIIGNLGADPETRVTPSGVTVTNIRVATTYKTKQNEETEWHRVVLFDRQAEIARDYLAKGSKVCIVGRLRTNKWQDKDGNDRYTTEVIAGEIELLSRAGDRQAPEQEPNEREPSSPAKGSPEEPFEDDIPF